MSLRVIAAAAPEWVARTLGDVLKGGDAISLHNANRVAAARARRGEGAWGDSNWACGRAERRRTVILSSARRPAADRREKGEIPHRKT